MFVPDRALEHLARATDEPDLSATKYRILRALGRGGMGAVYAAEDTELGREVAIKVSTGAHAAAIGERLRREARVIARLEHPGIVPVHDLGLLPDGRIFYVMKVVRGERLDAWVAREIAAGRDLRARLRLVQRVCEAVGFAHARGVVHRDLKPENVMVGEFGEALVMDWGIAKELSSTRADEQAPPPAAGDVLADTLPVGGEGATVEGTVLGTPVYMSPEQARGEVSAQGARSDVYALGAILYFAIAGRPPFAGRTAAEVIERVIAGRATPLRELAPDVPAPVASIAMRAMALEPEDRYASALELSGDVGRYLDAEPVRAHRETVLEVAARFARRHQVVLSLLAVYLVVRALLFLLP